ncbi:DNA alkylation repair protein [Labedella endophytica]|uniref:DNA alkylation repair protein n=1 Tax=Labedella endophytica TaxID=1523160 RepID=A0A3S0VAN6_9MICO|nr:DNA alkylation repair protein [Labedella endophytica]RUR00843.1 DNA alkylation repair protein [Labedella endophytica]
MGAFDEFIGRDAVDGLRRELLRADPSREWGALGAVHASLESHALKARSDLVARALGADVGNDYAVAAAAYRTALASELFRGWTIWPVTESAVTLALADGSPAAFDDALALLAELTPRLTSEFAIRRLLIADLDRGLAAVREWVHSEDEHVRRLASEGTRPYLPWAVRVPALLGRSLDLVPVLEALRDDDSEYVRRSVANHLNDIARHDPSLVVDVARRWMDGAEVPRERTWVVKHGLRTLVKKGDPGALAVLGFTASDLTVSTPVLSATSVTVPGELSFDVEVRNDGTAPARIVLDYVVHYRKANGSLSPKVFKLSSATLAAGETRRFGRSHAFRPLTTRVHHGGPHALQVQANGVLSKESAFDVVVA